MFLHRPSPSGALSRRSLRSGEIRIGDTIKDRFVIEDLLGVGGMGRVYLATDLRKKELSDRNPHVAIKVLKEGLRDHPLSIMAMQREARKAQELAHPNIIKVYDFDRDGDQYYITMEHLVGQSLDRVIKAAGFKPASLAEILPMIREIGAALSFAHANGFVHCDLKPGNIFITRSGRVKVIDFGIARAIKTSLAGADDATVFSPEDLAALTPAYASPQMIDLRDPEPSDDVFALACIAYELLSGQHPFRRVPSTHARDAGMKPKRLPSLSTSQWQAVTRALSFGARERTPSVAAFLEELSGGDRRSGFLPTKLFGRINPLVVLCAGCGALGFGLVALWSGATPPPAGVASPVQPSSAQAAPSAQAASSAQAAPSAPSPEPAAVSPGPPPSTPAVISPVPRRPTLPLAVPGASDAAFVFGSWCGDGFKMAFGPAEGALTLPSGTETSLRIERYQLAAGRLAVHTIAPDGGRSIWEFGSLADDSKSLIHLRLQNSGGDWRTYNRRLRKC